MPSAVGIAGLRAGEDVKLFPLSARVDFIVEVLQLKAVGRPFTARMVTLGAFTLGLSQHR